MAGEAVVEEEDNVKTNSEMYANKALMDRSDHGEHNIFEERTGENTGENTSEHIIENTSENISEHTSENISEHTSENISEH